MMRRDLWLSRVRLIGISLILMAIFLLVSPLFLLIPSALYDIDWTRTSNIGQSYTGVATILSAAALLGVVYSIRLQRAQNSITQGHLIREMQFKLLEMAMGDPLYANVLFRDVDDADEISRSKLDMYRNQWLKYVEYAYLVNAFSEPSVRRILASELFPSRENRDWWTGRAAAVWQVDSDPHFYKIVQEAVATAEEARVNVVEVPTGGAADVVDADSSSPTG